MDVEPERPIWRIRRPGSTTVLVVVFVALLIIWIQFRPDTASPSPPTTRPPATTRVGDVTSSVTPMLP